MTFKHHVYLQTIIIRYQSPSYVRNKKTWRGHMMTSSNGNSFRVTGPWCGEFTGQRWIPAQRPVTRSFDVFFDLCLNQQLSKQWKRWWFETPSSSLCCHCNDLSRNCSCVIPQYTSCLRHHCLWQTLPFRVLFYQQRVAKPSPESGHG